MVCSGAIPFKLLHEFVMAEADAGEAALPWSEQDTVAEPSSWHPFVPPSVGSRVCQVLVKHERSAHQPSMPGAALSHAFRGCNTDATGAISWQEWCLMADGLLVDTAAADHVEADAVPTQAAAASVGAAPSARLSPAASQPRSHGARAAEAATPQPPQPSQDMELYDAFSSPACRDQRLSIFASFFDAVSSGDGSSDTTPVLFSALAAHVENVATGYVEGGSGNVDHASWFARVLACTQGGLAQTFAALTGHNDRGITRTEWLAFSDAVFCAASAPFLAQPASSPASGVSIASTPRSTRRPTTTEDGHGSVDGTGDGAGDRYVWAHAGWLQGVCVTLQFASQQWRCGSGPGWVFDLSTLARAPIRTRHSITTVRA